MLIFSGYRRHRRCHRYRCPAPFSPPSPPPPFRMGNLLTSPAQFDAARLASGVCPSSEGAPLVAATGPAKRAATRLPSAESVKAAARAGIAGAAEQRSSLPTRPAEMWAELGAEERAFVRRCFGRLVSAGERRGGGGRQRG